ncbi:MAG: GAF domain-containing protein [Desulfobacterales bacterium]
MLSEQEKLERIVTLATDLSQVHDLEILMERIVTEARHFVGADAGSIYICEDDILHLRYPQNDTVQRRLPPGEKLPYSTVTIEINKESVAGYVATTGQVLNIPDMYHIEPSAPYDFNQSVDTENRYETHATLTVPLLNKTEDVIGVLQVINPQDEEGQIVPFSEPDEIIMLSFASIAAVALERARMTRAILLRMIRMAEMRDPKETGAHVNRVAEFAVELYERWARLKGIGEAVLETNRDIFVWPRCSTMWGKWVFRTRY